LESNKPYHIYVKRTGKWIKFTPKPVKGKDVRRVMRWVLDNNIVRSAIPVVAKGKTIRISKRINSPVKYFRKPKGKSTLPSIALVEKVFFALNTVGEVRQISLAKLRKQAFGKQKPKTEKRATRRKKRR